MFEIVTNLHGWWDPHLCPVHETETMLEFQKNLRLSLLREEDSHQDQARRPPETGDV